MAQVMPPPWTFEQSPSPSEDILAEVARFEHGERVLNDHYTWAEYAQRRLGHISRHPDYRNTLNIHIKVRRESDEVFGPHSHRKLSVQSVREHELTFHIEPLTPLPTTANTQTIDDWASYPAAEWQPGMPERWQDFEKSSSPKSSNEVCTAPEQNSVHEGTGYFTGVQQKVRNASASQDSVQLRDRPESHDVVSTSASVTDKAQPLAPDPFRTLSLQVDKSNIPSAAPEHRASGHPMPPAFTTASSLYNRPLQSHVKSNRRSQRLSATTVPMNHSLHLSLRKVEGPPVVSKPPRRKAKHNKNGKKDMKSILSHIKATVDSDQGKPVAEKRVTFCLARADSPLDNGGSQKVSTSNSAGPPTEERAELSASSERMRLKSLGKVLQWTQGRSNLESQGGTQVKATGSPYLGEQSNAEEHKEQSRSADVPMQDGDAILEQQRPRLPPPIETTAASNDSQATTREKYIDEIAAGVRLPRNRNDATTASHRRRDQLLSQHPDQTKRNTPRLRRSFEGPPRYPDMLPEFFSPANFQVRDLKPTGAVRCACGANTDDPSRFPAAADSVIWVQCENSSCRVWQHVDCMGAAVPWVAQSVPHSRLTRRVTRETADSQGADGNDAVVASTRLLNPDIKYFCHVCDPWAHRHLLAELRKAKPIVSEKETGV